MANSRKNTNSVSDFIDIVGLGLAIWFWYRPVESVGVLVRCLIILFGFGAAGHKLWQLLPFHQINKQRVLALLSVAYLLTIRPLVFPPPSYLYVIPSLGLGENSIESPQEFIPRRAFVVAKEGPIVFQHPIITLHDRAGGSPKTVEYPEISDASIGSSRFYFWWPVSTPWNEHYTITIDSHEGTFTEAIHIHCSATSAFISIRLVDDETHNLLFECDDEGFAKVWKHAPSCASIIPKSELFELTLDPRPFAISLPNWQYRDFTPDKLTENQERRIVLNFGCPDVPGPIQQYIYRTSQRSINCPPLPPLRSAAPLLEANIGPNSAVLFDWQKAELKPVIAKYPHQRLLILVNGDSTTWKYALQFYSVLHPKWEVKGPLRAPPDSKGNPIMDVQVIEGGPSVSSSAVDLNAVLKRARIKGPRNFTTDPHAQTGVIVLVIGPASPKDIDPENYPPYESPALAALTNF